MADWKVCVKCGVTRDWRERGSLCDNCRLEPYRKRKKEEAFRKRYQEEQEYKQWKRENGYE